MARKELEKHWETMCWWMEQSSDAKVWSNAGIEWYLTANPSWKYDADYVISDKLAVYRKAIIDRADVQVKVDGSDWKSIFKILPEHLLLDATQFRIKEMRKIGDFVRLKGVVYEVEEISIQNYGNPVCNTRRVYRLNSGTLHIDIDELPLWEPERGEWVWHRTTLYRFVKQFKNGSIELEGAPGLVYDIEPFTNQLPRKCNG